jgi:hypothetical protein
VQLQNEINRRFATSTTAHLVTFSKRSLFNSN